MNPISTCVACGAAVGYTCQLHQLKTAAAADVCSETRSRLQSLTRSVSRLCSVSITPTRIRHKRVSHQKTLGEIKHLILVFCCYQQVWHFFKHVTSGGDTWYSRWGAVMACPHFRMVRMHTHSLTICQSGFPLPSLQFSSSWVSFSYGRSSLTADTFLWPHCL